MCLNVMVIKRDEEILFVRNMCKSSRAEPSILWPSSSRHFGASTPKFMFSKTNEEKKKKIKNVIGYSNNNNRRTFEKKKNTKYIFLFLAFVLLQAVDGLITFRRCYTANSLRMCLFVHSNLYGKYARSMLVFIHSISAQIIVQRALTLQVNSFSRTFWLGNSMVFGTRRTIWNCMWSNNGWPEISSIRWHCIWLRLFQFVH